MALKITNEFYALLSLNGSEIADWQDEVELVGIFNSRKDAVNFVNRRANSYWQDDKELLDNPHREMVDWIPQNGFDCFDRELQLLYKIEKVNLWEQASRTKKSKD